MYGLSSTLSWHDGGAPGCVCWVGGYFQEHLPRICSLSVSGGLGVKNPPPSAGHPGSIPGLGKSSGEGNGNPFQYSCLKNLMDRGAWWPTVHGVTE